MILLENKNQVKVIYYSFDSLRIHVDWILFDGVVCAMNRATIFSPTEIIRLSLKVEAPCICHMFSVVACKVRIVLADRRGDCLTSLSDDFKQMPMASPGDCPTRRKPRHRKESVRDLLEGSNLG